ncbi:MAG: hypothetical protein M3354_03435 [Chloroflexota bacterium]|nr:hypothetical protein [Chloroflexota bacterium]
MKEFVTDVGHEGQMVLPEEVRELLSLGAPGQVTIVITDEGTVQLHPPSVAAIEAARGAAGSLDRPLPWEQIEEIAQEDRADRLARKLGVAPNS